MRYVFKTKDHPEASGRTAQAGEIKWAVVFSIEDGGKLTVEMSQKGIEQLAKAIEVMRQSGCFAPK